MMDITTRNWIKKNMSATRMTTSMLTSPPARDSADDAGTTGPAFNPFIGGGLEVHESLLAPTMKKRDYR
jgi:hypothetical protein